MDNRPSKITIILALITMTSLGIGLLCRIFLNPLFGIKIEGTFSGLRNTFLVFAVMAYLHDRRTSKTTENVLTSTGNKPSMNAGHWPKASWVGVVVLLSSLEMYLVNLYLGSHHRIWAFKLLKSLTDTVFMTGLLLMFVSIFYVANRRHADVIGGADCQMTRRFFQWVDKLYPWRGLIGGGVGFVFWQFFDPHVEPFRCKDGFSPPYYGGGPSAVTAKCVTHGGLLTNWSGYCIALAALSVSLFIWLMLAEWHLRVMEKSN